MKGKVLFVILCFCVSLTFATGQKYCYVKNLGGKDSTKINFIVSIIDTAKCDKTNVPKKINKLFSAKDTKSNYYIAIDSTEFSLNSLNGEFKDLGNKNDSLSNAIVDTEKELEQIKKDFECRDIFAKIFFGIIVLSGFICWFIIYRKGKKCEIAIKNKSEEFETQKIEDFINAFKTITGKEIKEEDKDKNLESLKTEYCKIQEEMERYNELKKNKKLNSNFLELIKQYFNFRIDVKISDLQNEIEKKDKKIADLEETIEKNISTNILLEEKKKELEKERKKKKGYIGKIAILNSRINDYIKGISDRQDLITEKDKEIKEKITENKNLSNDLSKTKSDLLSAKEKIGNMQLKEDETINAIKTFEQKIEKTNEIKFKTLRTLTTNIYVLKNLTIPLLHIWKKQNIEEKVNENISELSEELLISLETKRMYNVYIKSKPLDDFINLKIELNAHFNNYLQDIKMTINEDIWEKLILWFNRSKEYDDLKKLEKENDNQQQQIVRLNAETAILTKKVEENKIFTDKMYLHFVEDFSKHLKKNNFNSNEGKSWFFEHLFNIAYHAIDFVNYSNGTPLQYSYNYTLLQGDLNFSKLGGDIKDFTYNDADNSDTYSNAIYKFAKQLHIEELKILIDRFHISNFNAEVE